MTKTNQELEAFAGWDKLDNRERQTVRKATETAIEALAQENQSKVAIGEGLATIREVMQPKHLWMAFLKAEFKMSRATAYRYIEEYQRVAKALPKKVLSIAKERGFKIKPQSVVNNPPPTTSNVEEIVHYLEKLERPVVVNPPREFDSDLLLKECVNFVRTRFQRLPSNGRTRASFIRSLIGMLMSTFSVTSVSSYGPIAVPDGFIAKRGRPPLAKAA